MRKEGGDDCGYRRYRGYCGHCGDCGLFPVVGGILVLCKFKGSMGTMGIMGGEGIMGIGSCWI